MSWALLRLHDPTVAPAPQSHADTLRHEPLVLPVQGTLHEELMGDVTGREGLCGLPWDGQDDTSHLAPLGPVLERTERLRLDGFDLTGRVEHLERGVRVLHVGRYLAKLGVSVLDLSS